MSGQPTIRSESQSDALARHLPGANVERLIAHRFDLPRFLELQRAVRSGALRPGASVHRGPIEPPGPHDVVRVPRGEERAALARRGEEAIARGELAIVVLAGGMATRFQDASGTPVVKATVEVEGGESFLSKKIADARRVAARCGGHVPIVILGSFATLPGLRRRLEERELLGDDVQLVGQSIALRMTPDGDVLGANGDRPLPEESYVAPGHGDLFPSLRDTGVLRSLRARGVTTLLVSNVDNLGATLDPAILGLALALREARGVAMLAETVERRPDDGAKAGVVVRTDGVLRILEGFRVPPDADTRALTELSINTFWIDVRRIDRPISLEAHAVSKQVLGREVLQVETLACEVTLARDEHGQPLVPFVALHVAREGRLGRFEEGRFYPVKDRVELERVRRLLSASNRGASHAIERTRSLEAAFSVAFPQAKHDEARLFFSPGRINLIGEHTDYNQGFVLPAAVDRGILALAGRRDDDVIELVSLDAEAPVRFRVAEAARALESSDEWGRYAAATMRALAEQGAPCVGMELVLTSDVPQGGGMSSSAALCLVIARAACALARVELAPDVLAKVAQRAEHLVGVSCGIMDPWSIAHGVRDHAIRLDCRSLESEAVFVPLGEHVFLVSDTGKARGLVSSEYNARPAECEEGARRLGELSGRTIHSLRDVTAEDLARYGDALAPRIRMRVEHVVHENARVLEAVSALREGSSGLSRFGRLLDASHASLRDRFEVSCPELDAMVELVRAHGGEAVLGARMMGGGFGGCTLSLIRRDAVARVTREVEGAYRSATGLVPAFHVVALADGLRELPRVAKNRV
jgi:galactokinase